MGCESSAPLVHVPVHTNLDNYQRFWLCNKMSDLYSRVGTTKRSASTTFLREGARSQQSFVNFRRQNGHRAAFAVSSEVTSLNTPAYRLSVSGLGLSAACVRCSRTCFCVRTSGAKHGERWHATAYDNAACIEKMYKTMMLLWGRIVDDFFVFSYSEGTQNPTADQIVSIVHGAFERAEENETQPKVTRLDIARLLRSTHAVDGLSGSHFLSFCDMIAPDLLGRRALEVFSALHDKTSDGISVAELQHVLVLGQLSHEDIEEISRSLHPNDEISGSSTRSSTWMNSSEGNKCHRIRFSEMYGAMTNMVSSESMTETSSNVGSVAFPDSQPRLQRAETHRSRLERNRQR